MRWFGHEYWSFATDAMILAELLARIRPALFIDVGVYRGGSSLFVAHMLDINAAAGGPEDAQVLGIDRWDNAELGPDALGNVRPVHPRIVYVKGDSVAPDIIALAAEAAVVAGGPVFVSLDSDHTRDHVYAEMDAYGPLVTSGSYLLVQDTNLGHDVLPDWGPGPAEAVADWLPRHPDFAPDPACERLLLTSHPGGWLLRK